MDSYFKAESIGKAEPDRKDGKPRTKGELEERSENLKRKEKDDDTTDRVGVSSS
jgi:hypothetical protein